jgi:hypothetical protein
MVIKFIMKRNENREKIISVYRFWLGKLNERAQMKELSLLEF